MRFNELLRAPETGADLGAGGAGASEELESGDVAADVEPALEVSNDEVTTRYDEVPESFDTQDDLAEYLANQPELAAEEEASETEAEETVDTEDESEELRAESEELESEESEEVEAESEELEAEIDEAEAVSDENAFARLKEVPQEQRKLVRELMTQAMGQRVAKEVAKREALQSELETATGAAQRAEQLEAELTQVRAEKVVPVATPEDPLADISNPVELDGIESMATRLDDWFALNLHKLQGEEMDDNTGEMVPVTLEHPLNPEARIALEDAVALRRRVQGDLQALPKRRAWLAQDASLNEQLVAKVPSLADAKSELSQAVNKTVAAMPWMKHAPGYRVAALHYNVGRELNLAADQAGVDVETLLTRLKSEFGGEETSTRSPTKKQAKAKRPRKPRARPVPAVRAAAASTSVPRESGRIDSFDGLVSHLTT